MSEITLALDLSTSSSGFAIFQGKKLVRFGDISPKVKGITKLGYPEAQLLKIIDVSSKIKDLVVEVNPEIIVIEEVNRGISRIGQKSLDALHFFVLDYLRMIDPEWVRKVVYVDSNGKEGWRGGLGLKLSEEDKMFNKEARAAKQKKLVVDWKVLAQRYVNRKYRTSFDVKANSEHSDIVDAIALGTHYLENLKK